MEASSALSPLKKRGWDWIEFETGVARVALHSIPPGIVDQIEISSPPRQRHNNPVKLSFEVDDAALERQRLESLGVTIVQHPWGTCDGVDPEGNIFGLYPAMKLMPPTE
jgi:hypothetical protein